MKNGFDADPGRADKSDGFESLLSAYLNGDGSAKPNARRGKRRKGKSGHVAYLPIKPYQFLGRKADKKTVAISDVYSKISRQVERERKLLYPSIDSSNAAKVSAWHENRFRELMIGEPSKRVKSRVYFRFDIVTPSAGGPVVVLLSRNADDDSPGLPGKTRRKHIAFKTLDAALSQLGKSRTGINGQRITVTVDGKKI